MTEDFGLAIIDKLYCEVALAEDDRLLAGEVEDGGGELPFPSAAFDDEVDFRQSLDDFVGRNGGLTTAWVGRSKKEWTGLWEDLREERRGRNADADGGEMIKIWMRKVWVFIKNQCEFAWDVLRDIFASDFVQCGIGTNGVLRLGYKSENFTRIEIATLEIDEFFESFGGIESDGEAIDGLGGDGDDLAFLQAFNDVRGVFW